MTYSQCSAKVCYGRGDVLRFRLQKSNLEEEAEGPPVACQYCTSKALSRIAGANLHSLPYLHCGVPHFGLRLSLLSGQTHHHGVRHRDLNRVIRRPA